MGILSGKYLYLLLRDSSAGLTGNINALLCRLQLALLSVIIIMIMIMMMMMRVIMIIAVFSHLWTGLH